MNVNKIDSTNFKAVNTRQAHNVLLSRLNTPKRYIKYKSFITAQENKNYDIILSTDTKNTLNATVYNKEGKVLFSKKENALSGILQISPLRFLKKIAKAAENIHL